MAFPTLRRVKMFFLIFFLFLVGVAVFFYFSLYKEEAEKSEKIATQKEEYETIVDDLSIAKDSVYFRTFEKDSSDYQGFDLFGTVNFLDIKNNKITVLDDNSREITIDFSKNVSVLKLKDDCLDLSNFCRRDDSLEIANIAEIKKGDFLRAHIIGGEDQTLLSKMIYFSKKQSEL